MFFWYRRWLGTSHEMEVGDHRSINMEQENKNLLTFTEAAVFLKVKESWLYDHVSRSEPRVPHIKLGGLLRFVPGDLAEFIQEHRRQ